jgi:hypothetical protein
MINNAYQLDLFGGLGGTDSMDYLESLQPMTLKAYRHSKGLNQAINSTCVFSMGGNTCLTEENTRAGAKHYTQLSLRFNFIRIDKGLFLAPNGKRLRRMWIVDELAEVSLVTELLNDLILQSGKRLSRPKYLQAFSMLLANLLNALNTEGSLIVPRRTHHTPNAAINPLNITPTITNNVTNYLALVGLVTSHTGKSNEYEGNASWLTPTEELEVRLIRSEARIRLARGTHAIVLKDRGKKHRKLPTDNAAQLEITRLSKPVRVHNKAWLEHRLTYQGRHTVPFIKRTFNNDSLALGGRFYNEGSHYQNLPCKERKKLLIDGAVTVEIDYKSIHFNLLYSQTDSNAPKDPYEVKGYTRATMKSACLILLNSENLPAFKRNVTKSGNPKTIEAVTKYRQELSLYNEHRARGLKVKPPFKPLSFEGFIDGIPEGTIGLDLLTAIEDAHEPIKHLFGTPDIGLRLQYLDSEIMALAILKLEGMPVLPVHDSLICKVSDYLEVETAMLDAYYELTDRTITVTDNLTRRF